VLGGLPGSLTSEAVAVNSSGQAVGTSLLTSDSDGHAVLFANGKVTDLNAPAPEPVTRRRTRSTTTE